MVIYLIFQIAFLVIITVLLFKADIQKTIYKYAFIVPIQLIMLTLNLLNIRKEVRVVIITIALGVDFIAVLIFIKRKKFSNKILQNKSSHDKILKKNIDL
ncbi:hypothetical protein HZI73_04240 [Vallitalea pronyensis]|uniref:Uncharacterized protein n=1 Tax=Vallitalea pronyensis TaxID=1348613 RepID=A0A8J8SFE2_9FIRM|nr:hypothetical protein [Vallitalea pronyensis]QUI21550.1 hypothetical protein HZI73_04240 [Vallitalea pronyensis]